MSKETSTPTPAVAPKVAPAAKVLLKMHPSQTRARVLDMGDGVVLAKNGDPIEVDADTAAKLLERRDEAGNRYVVEAKKA